MRMWQSAVLELDDAYEIATSLLIVEFHIRRFFHRAAGCGLAAKDETVGQTLKQRFELKVKDARCKRRTIARSLSRQ